MSDPHTGQTRSTPDGGSQTWVGNRWVDSHTPAAKAARESAEAAAEAATPQNVEAEQALLGSLLMWPEAFFEVEDALSPASFYEPTHARIYEVYREIAKAGETPRPEIIAGRLKQDPDLRDLGGLGYLVELIDRAPAATTTAEYAREVAALATRRDLVRVCGQLSSLARDPEFNADEVLAEAERLVGDVGTKAVGREAWLSGASVIATAIATARGRNGVMDALTGVREVDELVGGFNKGELSIIAGRPGMAKSIVASQIAKANASGGKGTVFFSQEMGEEPLGLRLACDLAYDRARPVYMGQSDNPTFDRARKNRLTAEEWGRLNAAAQATEDWPLLFDVRPGLTVAQMEAAARRAFRRWQRQGIEPGCVVIDHMGKIKPGKDRGGSKHAEVADISNELAAMAKRLGVPVICLCQLNRQVEGREDKRPTLADLRQAGEIEEDARCVIFLLRPAYYLRPPEDPGAEDAGRRAEREAKLDRVRNHLIWVVAKNNNGLLGEVTSFIDVGCAAVRSLEAA